ncbi:MAG: DUF3185 domain-containing protein [Planctomycetota bacterium]|nr:DUF3185 domain-containing protein [Planctomycetota bacterium]
MRNSVLIVIGVLLIAVGAVALFYRGIPYVSRDVVIDIGPVTATSESNKTWPVPPILGGGVIAVGALLLFAGSRKVSA